MQYNLYQYNTITQEFLEVTVSPYTKLKVFFISLQSFLFISQPSFITRRSNAVTHKDSTNQYYTKDSSTSYDSVSLRLFWVGFWLDVGSLFCAVAIHKELSEGWMWNFGVWYR